MSYANEVFPSFFGLVDRFQRADEFVQQGLAIQHARFELLNRKVQEPLLNCIGPKGGQAQIRSLLSIINPKQEVDASRGRLETEPDGTSPASSFLRQVAELFLRQEVSGWGLGSLNSVQVLSLHCFKKSNTPTSKSLGINLYHMETRQQVDVICALLAECLCCL